MLATATPAGTALAAVEQVRAGLAVLMSIDPLAMSSDARLEILEATVTADSQLAAASCRFLTAIHEQFDTDEEVGRTTRAHLIEDLRCAPADANRRMRLARRLRYAPHTEAAMQAGQINPDHALLIINALERLDEQLRPTVEAVLVDLARCVPPPELARAITEIIERYAPADDAEERARREYERKYAERGIALADTIGGTGSLSGTLTPDVLATVRHALNVAGAKAGPDDERSIRQRWHDALGEIAAFYLANGETGDVNGERPRVIVTMTLQDLLTKLCLGGYETAGHILGTCTPLTAATARRLACDAEILPAVLGGKSEVLDLGRTSRTWTIAQRRAAWIRDNGRCTFPRCTRQPRELHHLRFWAEHHGPSDLINGAWVCTHHHWLVHEGGWTAHRDATGTVVFAPAEGRKRRRHS